MKVWTIEIKLDGDEKSQVALYGHMPTEQEFRDEVIGYLGPLPGEEPEMEFKEDEYGLALSWGKWGENQAYAFRSATEVTP